MTRKHWVAVGALASMSFVAAAQQAPDRPNPLDANAAVPAASYQSAFDNYQRASRDEQPSADKVWRKANDEVAKTDLHLAHAAQEAVTAPAPAKAPPVDHSKHH
jgi:hypothetical protein